MTNFVSLIGRIAKTVGTPAAARQARELAEFRTQHELPDETIGAEAPGLLAGVAVHATRSADPDV